MKLNKLKILLGIVAVTTVAIFFGCESNFKNVQNINSKTFDPIGEADDVNLKYTDSGRIQAILISKKMFDYSNAVFPFTEFPIGVDVILFDEKGKKNFVRSDYAITYSKSDIIDLRGNVKITSDDGKVFETEQLYYDQKNEWFFTEYDYKFTDVKSESFGKGIDFSKDFKTIKTRNFRAEIDNVEEK